MEEISHSVEIDVPTAANDLGRWILGMSDAEYQQCAKGHRAMGVLGDAERAWDMQVTVAAHEKSDLRCAIEVVLPLIVRMMGSMTGAHHVMKQHLIEDTENFAGHRAKSAGSQLTGKLGRLTTAHAA